MCMYGGICTIYACMYTYQLARLPGYLIGPMALGIILAWHGLPQLTVIIVSSA